MTATSAVLRRATRARPAPTRCAGSPRAPGTPSSRRSSRPRRLARGQHRRQPLRDGRHLPARPRATEAGVADRSTANINRVHERRYPAPTGFDAGWETTGAFERLFIRAPTATCSCAGRGTNAAARTCSSASEQGGIEVTRFAQLRPAPTGVRVPSPDFAFFETAAGARANGLASITLNKYDGDDGDSRSHRSPPGRRRRPADEPDACARSWPPSATPSTTGRDPAPRRGLAVDGGALGLSPGDPPDQRTEFRPARTTTAARLRLDAARRQRRRGRQRPLLQPGRHRARRLPGPGSGGADGTAPIVATTYDDAYDVVAARGRPVQPHDPRRARRTAGALARGPVGRTRASSPRSAGRLLLMEPPPDWSGAQTGDERGHDAAHRAGASEYAALYYPRITIQEGRLRINVGATGAIAGLMARIDGDARRVEGAGGDRGRPARHRRRQRAALRPRERRAEPARRSTSSASFPTGIVSWGARTMDGDDDFAQRVQVRAGPPARAVPRGEPLPRAEVGGVRAERRAAVGADPAQRRRVHAGPVPPGRVPGHDAAGGVLRQVRRRDHHRRPTATSASSTSGSASRR